jgi:predicted glycosyltransferase
MARPPRILLYAHDGRGIGHAVRACVVARAILRQRPEATVVIATGAPVSEFVPEGARHVTLPDWFRPDAERPASRDDKRRRDEVAAARRRRLRDLADELRPNVLLVDHLPSGRRYELEPVLDVLVARGVPLLLGYRRIAEDLTATREVFEDERYAAALARFREVLVYAPKWVERDGGPLPDLPCPQRHVGFVCRELDLDRAAARSRLGVKDELVIAAGFGGGRDAWPLVEELRSAWRAVGPPDARLLVYCGPMMQPPAPLDGSPPSPRAQLVVGSTDFPVGAAAADVVISTAGYNSMLEVVRLGRPLLALPNQPREREQALSAKRLAALGLVELVRPGEPWSDVVRAALARASSGGDAPRPRAPAAWFSGDVTTARILLAEAAG